MWKRATCLTCFFNNRFWSVTPCLSPCSLTITVFEKIRVTDKPGETAWLLDWSVFFDLLMLGNLISNWNFNWCSPWDSKYLSTTAVTGIPYYEEIRLGLKEILQTWTAMMMLKVWRPVPKAASPKHDRCAEGWWSKVCVSDGGREWIQLGWWAGTCGEVRAVLFHTRASMDKDLCVEMALGDQA